MKKILIFLLLASVTTRCATIFNGSSETVNVRSEEPNAKIFVDENPIGQTSATTVVPKKGDHIIRVSKEGCSDVTMPIRKTFDATSLLGIFLDFGIISMLVVDGAATGAINKIEPKSYIATPICPNKPNEPKQALVTPAR